MTLPTPLHIPSSLYAQRRARVATWLKAHGGGVAVLPTAPEINRNRDNTYSYRADSYFYYLTGFTEPESWLVIEDSGRSTLFCRPNNVDQEIWTGVRLGPDAAPQALGLDAAHPVDALDVHMPTLLTNQPAVWYPFATHTGLESHIAQWLKLIRDRVRMGTLCPEAQHDLCAVLDEMRLIKDDTEIALLRRAGEISACGHARAMQTCARMVRAGEEVREYHLEAELLHEFCRHGAQEASFNAIVAAGKNACILHYRAGHTPIAPDQLVLIDAGCEYGCYAGDISRTFPASGRFTAPQRDLYDLVLAAQNAAACATRAGALFDDPHTAAVRVLAQGMLDLKLLNKGIYSNVDDVIEQKAYTRFYMHRTSHWLGLDVHDCGTYVQTGAPPIITEDPKTGDTLFKRPSRTLEPGMVLTLEPGIYIRAADDVPEVFHNMGIRIEDDALVAPLGTNGSDGGGNGSNNGNGNGNGCELLTRAVPVEASEIEKLMG